VGGRCSEAGGERLEKLSPRDGKLLYQFGTGKDADVDEAVKSARRAFDDGRWSKLPIQRRKDTLHRLAALIDEHREEFALRECLDVGKPIADALGFDVPASANYLRFAAEAADKFYGKVFAADRTSLTYQLLRPVGVVAGVIGWNFPLYLATSKIGPALAAGNTLVLKPSELTSLSAARVAQLALEAGVPEGVLNVVHGGPQVGAALAQHSDVDLLSFTGSSETGKALLRASGASNMKRLILECGGKAPNIVFEDCPRLEAVADAVIARAFWNQGQVCTASSRLLVQESIKDEIQDLILKKLSTLLLGDPLKTDTAFGPMVSRGHQRKVLDFIEGAEAQGARQVFRAAPSPPVEGGFFVAPAVFDNVSPAQNIAQKEIFGPVLSVLSFRDEAGAVQIANGTIYGLSAILWSRDLGRAHRVAQDLKTGWVVINATDKPEGGPGEGVISIGGHKESGVGLEGGVEGLEAYVSRTAVQMFM
jgi:acyl-CoA reductase-like NAD-dependent aldehyde dehydrogenase